jgi:hypothetical protein
MGECWTCDGSGEHPDEDGEDCPTCEGTGIEPYDDDPEAPVPVVGSGDMAEGEP